MVLEQEPMVKSPKQTSLDNGYNEPIPAYLTSLSCPNISPSTLQYIVGHKIVWLEILSFVVEVCGY